LNSQGRFVFNKAWESLENPVLKEIKSWLDEEPLPNIFEVLLSSINVMETQTSQIRLHTDPPDLFVQPRLVIK